MGLSGIPGVQGLGGIVPGAAAPAGPEWLEFEVTTTAANQAYAWQINSGTAINGTTEWGDGAVSTHQAAGTFTRTYAQPGTYTVRIQVNFGTVGRFNLRPDATRTRITRLLSPIPNFAGLVDIAWLCSGCINIPEIPADFFRYIVECSNFNRCFTGCAALGGVTPPDLLRYNVNALNLSFLFNGCPDLQLAADIFGPDPNRFLNQDVLFSGSFGNVGTNTAKPQGTAPEIWSYNFGTGTPATTNTFAGSTRLTNWASIPSAWGGPA